MMKSWIATLIIVATVAACGGSLAEATPTPESTPEPTVEISTVPATVTPSTPNPDSANRIVCETIRTTVSGSLADAVDAYNSGQIGLYDLGTIYNAWASGARNLNASASGAVRSDVERLIKLAEQTGNAGESGYESATVDGVVAFAGALDSLSASCP
jgi:hypothetical protein